MKKFNLTNGRTLELVQDFNAENPRTAWDNLSKFIFFGNYRTLGEKHDFNAQHYSSWVENQEAVEKKLKPAIIVPIYMYSHSGITISLKPFSCPWDSGQLGWVVITKEDAYKEYNIKRITKKTLDKIQGVIEAEVKSFDQYLTGDVWGYVIRDKNGDEEDSCWGYFGSDVETNGIIDNLNELDKIEVLEQK